MGADIFGKIGDIKGESGDAKHKDEIEILSYSWGVSQTGTMAFGGGGGAGKANFQDFNFMHYLDKASPVLLQRCASGEHIKEATITVRKAGQKEPLEYLVIKLSDILVSSVSSSGTGDASTSESVTLNYAKVIVEYKPQKADGSLDAGVFFKYDLKANKEG
jgi:type VI secretion system secreted protein Hcp